MRKWYRKNWVKGILIVLVHVLLTAAVLAGLFILLMADAGVDFMDSSKEFGYSRSFADKLFDQARGILDAEEGSSVFTPPSSAHGNLLVDLKEMEDGQKLTWKNTSGVAYNYEDLKDWSQSRSYSDREFLVCLNEDGEELYFDREDFQDKVRLGQFQVYLDSDWEPYAQSQGILFDQNGESFEEKSSAESVSEPAKKEFVLDLLEPWNGELDWALSEYGPLKVRDTKEQQDYTLAAVQTLYSVLIGGYAPVGAECLSEAVNASEAWRGRLEEAFQVLDSTISRVAEKESELAELRNYEEGSTNLTYLYANLDDQSVYTNRKEYDSFQNHARSVEEMTKDGYYIVVSSVLGECFANISLEEYSLRSWQHMVETSCGSGNYIFAIHVDGDFPIMDDLALSESYYNRFSGYGLPVLATGTASAALLLVCVIWLTIVAGRSASDEEIHLCWFDRWYTEIAAGAVISPWIASIMLIAEIAGYYGMYYGNAVLYSAAAIMSLCTAALFSAGYLSLVRRIKAGNLWEVSLCRRGWNLLILLLKRFWNLLILLLKRFWNLLILLLEKFRNLVNASARFAGRTCHMVTASLAATVKTMLLFGGFALAQFVIIMMLLVEPVFLILLVLVDGCTALYVLSKAHGRESILGGLEKITDGELQYKIPTELLRGDQKTIAEYINRIGDGLDAAVEESVRSERMKTELITNVSHDIKTPLTSIINYVDLLKRENIADPKIQGYLDVLDEKAQRLKVLTEDVVEASKASTGSITLNMAELNFVELTNQVAGEFQEKLQSRGLVLMLRLCKEPVIIRADGQRMWRVLENIFNNVVKYALEGTRVYAEVNKGETSMEFSLKNISDQPLNISPDELTERFIRGDLSRNTEGSGLGLSIARSLTELQGGSFRVYVDGDLFKVVITFELWDMREQKEETTDRGTGREERIKEEKRDKRERTEKTKKTEKTEKTEKGSGASGREKGVWTKTVRKVERMTEPLKAWKTMIPGLKNRGKAAESGMRAEITEGEENEAAGKHAERTEWAENASAGKNEKGTEWAENEAAGKRAERTEWAENASAGKNAEGTKWTEEGMPEERTERAEEEKEKGGTEEAKSPETME